MFFNKIVGIIYKKNINSGVARIVTKLLIGRSQIHCLRKKGNKNISFTDCNQVENK